MSTDLAALRVHVARAEAEHKADPDSDYLTGLLDGLREAIRVLQWSAGRAS